jgi:heptosyltransferase-1
MRILFVKVSSLGDVIHNAPAVSDAARAFPDAAIDWVVEEPFDQVAALHPAVRRVIPVAIRRWRRALYARRTWREMDAFRHALRDEPYDFVVDTQGLWKSGFIAALAAGRRHGFDRASAREPGAARFYDVRHAVPTGLHAVERNRRLAAAALGYTPGAAPDYGLHAGGDSPLEVAAPFALLLTMTSRRSKLWPKERWKEVCAALAARGVTPVLPWGSDPERRRCERIARKVPAAVVPRRMSLAELARLMQRARCVAGVDTGLAHLAAALGAPVVGIYCDSDPALTGLYGSARARNLGAAGAPPSAGEVLRALEEVA